MYLEEWIAVKTVGYLCFSGQIKGIPEYSRYLFREKAYKPYIRNLTHHLVSFSTP